jgi:hypothetical protein
LSGDESSVLICTLKFDDLFTNSKFESQWQQSRFKAATKIAANQQYHLLPGAWIFGKEDLYCLCTAWFFSFFPFSPSFTHSSQRGAKVNPRKKRVL